MYLRITIHTKSNMFNIENKVYKVSKVYISI